MANLGRNYTDAGRLDEAIALLEEALRKCQDKLLPEHPTMLMTMDNLAMAYEATGRLDKALPLYEETLRLKRKKLGPDHPDTLDMHG